MSAILMRCAALALAAMMAILTWQVFARFVLGNSPAWAEQTALLLMIWMTFLGTASGIAEGFHIRIMEGVASLPVRWRGPAVGAANLLVALAGALTFWLGIDLVVATWGNAVPTLPLSRGMAYLVIPLSGLLMAVFALRKLVRGEEIDGSLGSA
ncbi:TRAP transporter small permease [Aurantiacibacter luteus]|nr:TRAP transporter small permease [Aurantiacibacter luteus]